MPDRYSHPAPEFSDAGKEQIFVIKKDIFCMQHLYRSI
jgi:hypothetical protein